MVRIYGSSFGVNVSLQTALDFSQKRFPKNLEAIREACLDPNDLATSMELGRILESRSIQGSVFPSVVGSGKNLVVYLNQCQPFALELHNVDELMRKMRKIVG